MTDAFVRGLLERRQAPLPGSAYKTF